MTAPSTTPAATIASMWRRTAAFLLDLVFLAPVVGLLTWIWFRLFQVYTPPANLPTLDYVVQIHFHGDPLWRGGLVFLAACMGAYFLLFPLLSGATPGMRLLRLELVDATGAEPSVGCHATRVAASGISAAYFGLGFLWIAFDGDRQGFHDKVAGTYVIHRRATPAQEAGKTAQ